MEWGYLFHRFPLKLRYTDLVLGSSAEAYAFAFEHQYPILDMHNSNHYHDHLETIPGPFSFAGMLNGKAKIYTNLGEKEEWTAHKETIRKLLRMCMGMNGHVPFSNFSNMATPPSIGAYVDSKNNKVLITREKSFHEITYETLHVFSKENVSGNLYEASVMNDVVFIDYLTCQKEYNRGNILLDSFYCEDEDNAISEIHFAIAPENNVIIKSNFELDDSGNPDYGIAPIIMGVKNVIREGIGATPRFKKYRHVRKIQVKEYDKTPFYDNIKLNDNYDIVAFLNKKHANDNGVRILQLTMRDDHGKIILEGHRPETSKRISFQRKKGFSS